MTDWEILIIGAGAAGLAAAHALRGAGRMGVLEARDRVGGRVLSLSDPAFPLPIEGGAEYIHGRAAARSAFLRAAGVVPVDVADEHFLLQGGSLEPAEGFFAKAGELLGGLELTAADDSLEALLNRPSTDADEATKTLVRTLVEGFDAADPARASAAALAEEWRGGANEEGAQFRPLGGYGGLLRFFTRSITPEVTLLLNTVVREVRWGEGEVEVACERFGREETFRARRVIVTLPLSLLKQGAPGAVRFSPALQKEEALAGLELGPVVKVLLKFGEPFWEDTEDGRYFSAAYFHAPDAPFPTFWTSLPLRAPVLTAWAGGPKAARLGACSEEEIIERALSSLETLFPRVPRPEGVRVYDWQRDPFSKGAYSFVTVGGVGAREKLGAPLKNTLFFAGEATDTDGKAGTVYGALQSGVRAAREVLDAL